MKKRKIRQVNFKSSVSIQAFKKTTKNMGAFLSLKPSRTFVQYSDAPINHVSLGINSAGAGNAFLTKIEKKVLLKTLN